LLTSKMGRRRLPLSHKKNGGPPSKKRVLLKTLKDWIFPERGRKKWFKKGKERRSPLFSVPGKGEGEKRRGKVCFRDR